MAESTDGTELRFAFVEMLFALTIAQVAIQVAKLVDDLGLQKGLFESPASYTQLLLATVLVATSWIGWKMSVATGNQMEIESVFTFPFLILLLDVLLVVFYFILVTTTEMPTGSGRIVDPSAHEELFWMLAIFVGYLVWDILTKAIAPRFSQTGIGSTSGFWKRSRITIVCTVAAAVACLLLWSTHTQWKVVLVDLSLLSLVLTFRAWKQSPRVKGTRVWRGVTPVAFLVLMLLAWL